jgi:N-acetylneuraminic acid mutarotase
VIRTLYLPCRAAGLLGAVSLLGLAACHEDPLSPESAQMHSMPNALSAVANSWATKAPMPTARIGLVAAAVNGTIYAIGGDAAGWGGQGPTLRKVEAYSKAGNTWSPRAPLPSSRAYSNGATVINGTIYVAGGLFRPPLIIGKPILDPVPTKTLFVYYPARNSWARKADLPVASDRGQSAAINGKLYVVVTGSTVKGGSALYRYDPATNSWSQLASAPHPHKSGVAAAINGKLYVAGGWANKSSFADLDVYDPATDSWTTKAPMPTPRSGAVGRAINGKFYVAAGEGADFGYSNRLDVYDPVTNTWERKADIPTARWAAGAAVAGGMLHVIGGWNPGVTALTEAYAP